MQISGLLILIALAGLVAVFAGIAMAVNAAAQRQSTRGGVLLAVAGVVVAVLFFVISQGLIVVQPQEVAVIFDQVSGELLEPPRGSGVHIIVPVIQQPTFYDITQQEYTMSGVSTEGRRSGDDAVVGRTSDGQEVRVDATIIYSVDPAQANLVHVHWQTRYADELIRPTVRGIIRDEVARYTVEEAYSTEREAMREGIEALVRTRLAEEGIGVTDFLIRDIQFTAEYAASVEQKQIAEQNRLREDQEAERRRIEAQGLRDAAIFEAEGERQSFIERAEGEAESIRIRAEAEAEAILLVAEADAEALSLINEQISQNTDLIQWRYIDTLADNVELILIPSGSPFLFDFQSLTAQGGDVAADALAPAETTTIEPEPVTTEESDEASDSD